MSCYTSGTRDTSPTRDETSGGYCSGVPPLPIPNREVKPACADGTAMQCGRVGGRHLYTERSPVPQLWSGVFRMSCVVILRRYQLVRDDVKLGEQLFKGFNGSA